MTISHRCALRGPLLTFKGDPFTMGDEACVFINDALVVINDGHFEQVGDAQTLLSSLSDDVPLIEYSDQHVMMAGFVDCHVHYPQTQIIGAFGEQLLDWLNQYTFIAEQQFADKSHADRVAGVFLDECLRAGTTTAAVYCTVHPQSVDAFFEAASLRNMRMIAGKVLMDRHAPEALLDTAIRGYDESKTLINKWHGHGRNLYAITPRFAPTSTAEQLEMAGALWQEYPSCYIQSHVSENKEEVSWAGSLFPQCHGYLDIYDHFGLIGQRAVYGHGIWLTESELQRCHESGTAIAHCPTSNGFLGSGLFDIFNTIKRERPVAVGLATDLGAGTSFSMLQTLNEAYKVSQLNGHSLSAMQAFYLATLGGASALDLDSQIGSVEVGKEADLVVLDLCSTEAINFRMQYVKDITEALFVQMIMGDDRAVAATYVAGKLQYQRSVNN